MFSSWGNLPLLPELLEPVSCDHGLHCCSDELMWEQQLLQQQEQQEQEQHIFSSILTAMNSGRGGDIKASFYFRSGPRLYRGLALYKYSSGDYVSSPPTTTGLQKAVNKWPGVFFFPLFFFFWTSRLQDLVYTSNERVWCTTQLAKLSFNHSIGRTHSLRFSTFSAKGCGYVCEKFHANNIRRSDCVGMMNFCHTTLYWNIMTVCTNKYLNQTSPYILVQSGRNHAYCK